MTVREFCLKKTQNGELCVFRIYEQIIIGSTWIDNEGFFSITNSIKDKKVKSDEWVHWKSLQSMEIRFKFHATI